MYLFYASPDKINIAPPGVDAATGADADMLFSSRLVAAFGIVLSGSGQASTPGVTVTVPFGQTFATAPKLLTRRRWNTWAGSLGFNFTEDGDLPPQGLWLTQITSRTSFMYYSITSTSLATSWASFIYLLSFPDRVEIRHEFTNGGRPARYPICEFEFYVLDINV